MNILILSLRGPSNANIKGGAREFLRQVGIRWKKQGHNVRILCGFESDADGKILPEKEIIDGIEILRTGNSYLGFWKIIKEFTIVHEKWADIIIENMLSFPLFTPIFTKKPVFVITHVLEGSSYFKVKSILIATIGYFLQKLIPLFYKKAFFIAVSESTKKDLINLGISRKIISVVPNGTDTNYFKVDKKSFNPTICFVGRLEKRKRLNYLIDAFINFIHDEIPNSELLIAGSGDHEGYILEAAQKHPNISFLGLIDEDKKLSIYQKSWLFVLPSTKEGFPLVVLEANACGTPVIAYNVPGLECVINGINGFLVDKESPEALANCCISYIKNPKIKEKMAKKCREYAIKFDWDTQANNILKYIISNKN